MYSLKDSPEGPPSHQRTMGGGEKVRICIDHPVQGHFAKVKWQTSGSPTISFQDPYHTLKNNRRPPPKNFLHEAYLLIFTMLEIKLKMFKYL